MFFFIVFESPSIVQVIWFKTLYVIFFNFFFGFQGEVIFKAVVIVMAFRVSNFELLAVFWKSFDFSYKLIIPIESEMKFNRKNLLRTFSL